VLSTLIEYDEGAKKFPDAKKKACLFYFGLVRFLYLRNFAV